MSALRIIAAAALGIATAAAGSGIIYGKPQTVQRFRTTAACRAALIAKAADPGANARVLERARDRLLIGFSGQSISGDRDWRCRRDRLTLSETVTVFNIDMPPPPPPTIAASTPTP